MKHRIKINKHKLKKIDNERVKEGNSADMHISLSSNFYGHNIYYCYACVAIQIPLSNMVSYPI